MDSEEEGDTEDSLSMERIVRTILSSRSDPLRSAARGHWRPRFEPATMLSRSNPTAPGILRPPMWTLWQIVPTADIDEFRKSSVWWGMHLTSSVFESNGSFQAGLSQPTLADRSVRLRYLGVMSRGYCETPLSIPSIPSMNSCVPHLSAAASEGLQEESTL